MKYITFILITMLIKPLSAQEPWCWSEMPSIPDSMGFAGAYAGHTTAGILVMGGANFPDGKAPWSGGQKEWTDRIFYLKTGGQAWEDIGRLPQQMGYGATASYNNQIFLAGGNHATGVLKEVYCLSYTDSLQIVSLPSLPMPLANTATALIGSYWYIMGGIQRDDAQEAETVCLRMDLNQVRNGWHTCPPIPGPGRMLAVASATADRLLLFSGVALENGQRRYLRDAYGYTEHAGWLKLPDLPHAVAAAPSPAFFSPADSSVHIIGGDDGILAPQNLREKHPGFSNQITVLDLNNLSWSHTQLPDTVTPMVTTTQLNVNGQLILPMGEVKPAVRTNRVYRGVLNKPVHDDNR